MGENHKDWFKYLQTILMAYRSSIHAVTKYRRYHFIFGHSCSLPVECLYETSKNNFFATLKENWKNDAKDTTKWVRETMNVEQERQKTYYDKKKQYEPKYRVNNQQITAF